MCAFALKQSKKQRIGVLLGQRPRELRVLKKVPVIILLLLSSYALAADGGSISTIGDETTKVAAEKLEKPLKLIRLIEPSLLDFTSLERAHGFADVADIKLQIETKPADHSLTREFISPCWALSLIPTPQLERLNSRGCAQFCRESTPSGQLSC
jgi:hypothetical protein